MQGAQDWSLVRELRSHKSCGQIKKKRERERQRETEKRCSSKLRKERTFTQDLSHRQSWTVLSGSLAGQEWGRPLWTERQEASCGGGEHAEQGLRFIYKSLHQGHFRQPQHNWSSAPGLTTFWIRNQHPSQRGKGNMLGPEPDLQRWDSASFLLGSHGLRQGIKFSSCLT